MLSRLSYDQIFILDQSIFCAENGLDRARRLGGNGELGGLKWALEIKSTAVLVNCIRVRERMNQDKMKFPLRVTK